MKMTRVVGFGALWAVSGTSLLRAQQSTDLAADVQKKITALERIVLQEPQAMVPPAPASPTSPGTTNAATTPVAPAPPFSGVSPAVRYVQALRHDTLRRDYLGALAAANNLAGADASDVVQKEVAALLPELQKLKDTPVPSPGSQTKDILDRAAQAIKTAKDPKDLDSLVADLAQAAASSRANYSDPDQQAAFTQLQGAGRFVKEWQSYLSDQASGNTMMAASDLRNLSNMPDTYSFMPIPRSALLEMAQKLNSQQPAVIDSKVEVHSFDDLPAAISQLQGLQRNGNYNQDANELMNALQTLRNAYLAYQDKNYTGALQSLQGGYPFSMAGMVTNGASVTGSSTGPGQNSLRKEIIALKDHLLVEIAQGLLDLPDAPAPDPDERAPDYLLRVAGLKAKAQDWTGLQQVLTTYGQFANNFFNQQSWLQEDLAGLHAYLVGEKLEDAGQTLDAIRSYRQSLATLGKFFPADPPAAKLKQLAAKFPDLYQQALQQPIAKTP